MRVYEAIAAELARLGVTSVFSVPASETMRIAVEASRRGITHYSARHEQAAVGMADGYSRSTGQVGVVIVGRGPGLTNGTNALVTAHKAGSGVLVIAGENFSALAADPDAAARHLFAMKTIDQTAYLTSLGIASVVIGDAASAVADLRAAFEGARSGQTVAALLRVDVAPAEAGSDPQRVAVARRQGTPVDPSADEIGSLADLLGETWAVSRPLILAGRGAVVAGAGPALRQVGTSIGALLGTTLAARSLFAGDPYDIGIVGTMSTPLTLELATQSDLVLSFGASLNPFTTFGGDIFRKARVVRIDTNARSFGGPEASDIEIAADARATAEALAAELARRGQRSVGRRTADLAERIRAGDAPSFNDRSKPGALDPRTAMIEVNKALPVERAVVFDGGAHLSFSARYLTVSDPRSIVLTHGDYGSVGAAQGIALGVAIARPERATVLAIGDGGLMMTLGDLDTAVRYQLPLIVVVLNDSAFGQEVHLLQIDGLPDDIARYQNPPFADVARAMGAGGITVRTVEDLAQLPATLRAVTGPVVVDCQVAGDVRGDHVDLVKRVGHGTPQLSGARER